MVSQIQHQKQNPWKKNIDKLDFIKTSASVKDIIKRRKDKLQTGRKYL